MDSMVIELQKQAMDSNSNTTSLLRKAYAVAKKLKIEEFEKWIHSELNGYTCDYDDIPEYRLTIGQLKGQDTVSGQMITALIPETDIAEGLQKQKIRDAIPYLENLIDSDKNDFFRPVTNEIRKLLSQRFGRDTTFGVMITKSQFQKILEKVQNIILEWSLRLEEDGIMGEDTKFTETEVITAQDKKYPIINNSIIFGDILGSQIQLNTSGSTQIMKNETLDIEKVGKLIKLLKEHSEELNLPKDEQGIYQAQINTIEAQIQSTKPNRRIVFEGFNTIRNLLEGATGSLIASGLIYQLGLFLGA